MPTPTLEPTVFIGSPQCPQQLSSRGGDQPRRERADETSRREPRERDER